MVARTKKDAKNLSLPEWRLQGGKHVPCHRKDEGMSAGTLSHLNGTYRQ